MYFILFFNITTKIHYFLWNENKNKWYVLFSIDKMLSPCCENLFIKKSAIPLDYNQKQCIKSPQTRQINSSTSPFRFHEDPGLHLLHTRISHALPPGSEETFQVVFTKKVACLHEKTSLFNLFCISFRTHLTFDKILIYNTLSLLPMIVMIDKW